MHVNTAHNKTDITKNFWLRLSLYIYLFISFNKQLLSTNFVSDIASTKHSVYSTYKMFVSALKQFKV